MRREFLQLLKTYQPGKTQIGGWYVSEKLDGNRCLWDGGISSGQDTRNVPWASVINPKTGEPKKKVKPVSTGLWSRGGNPIIVPDEFLNKLPPFPCDGELWAGRGNKQLCQSICSGDNPDPRFMDQIKFAVYSSPPLERLFLSGEIKTPSMVVTIDRNVIEKWLHHHQVRVTATREDSNFEQELFAMREWPGWDEQVFLLQQIVLPNLDPEAEKELARHMNSFLEKGGEGAVIRSPKSIWTPKRVASALKYKPWEDDEGTIVGFTSGRETNKGSKLLGMIGSLILDYNGQRLELAGLTNEEREFNNQAESDFAREHPDEDMPGGFQGKLFKVGDVVTFKYTGKTDAGIPKEARYWRARGEE